jgi:hypothetical protein
LEAAAAVWGMDVFNEYLRGKQFILFTDHKPLEKLGHLHTKTLNPLQTALLEHDFVVQYKKGAIMPADYLSRLPTLQVQNVAATVAAFNPFQPDLSNCNFKTQTFKPYTCFSRIVNGCHILQKDKSTRYQLFLKKLSLTKTSLLGSD